MTQDTSFLERRCDPRTHAFVPIKVHYHTRDDETPAHLLDLSPGGAGLLSTSYNAPKLGEFLDVTFEPANTDGGTEKTPRRELGVVVNLGTPERGITRVGIRFIQCRGTDSELFDPIDTLSDHQGWKTGSDPLRRWETARHFEEARQSYATSAW